MQKENTSPLGFPDEFVSREQKAKKEWLLTYAKAAWYEYKKYNGILSLSDKKVRMAENRAAAMGIVDVDKFKDRLAIGDTSYLNLNWNQSTPIPKYVDMLVDDIVGKDLGLKITSIDPESRTEVDKERAKMIAKILMRPLKEQTAKLTGEEAPKLQDEPEDLDEVELHLETNFKQDIEVDMEQAIMFVQYANDFEEIKREIVKDVIVYGVAGTKTFFDENLDIRTRRVDPFHLMTSPCSKSDFSDIRYMGEVVEMTIPDLRKLAQDQFTEEEWFQIAKTAYYMQGVNFPYGEQFNANTAYNEGYIYTDVKVKLLDLELFTANKLTYVEKKKKQGDGYFFEKKSADYTTEDGNKQVVQKTVKDVYRIKWIIETDYCFDLGLAENMVRPRSQGAYSTDVFSSFCLYAPSIMNSQTKALIEKIIPYGDDCILISLKMQQMIAAARPKGLAIDVAAISQVVDSLGIEGGSFLDVQELFDQKGIYYFSSMRDGYTPINSSKPVFEIDNGMSQDLERLQSQYNFSIQRIREVTGINPAREGAVPDKGTLQGVMQMNLQGSENATKYINNAYKYVVENTSKRICLMIQDLAGTKEIYGYSNAVGDDTVRMIQLAKDISFKSFGIKIEFVPSLEELQYIDQFLQLAIQADLVAPDDAAYVRRLSRMSVKSAERAFAVRRKKYQKKKEQLQMQTIQANTESQKQIALAASQAKAQEYQAEAQAKVIALQEEYKLKMELSKLEHDNAMKLEQLKIDGKLELVEKSQEDEGGNQIQDKSVNLDNTSTGTSLVRQPSVAPSMPTKNL